MFSINKLFHLKLVALFFIATSMGCTSNNLIDNNKKNKENSNITSTDLSREERQRAILNPYYLTDEFFQDNMRRTESNKITNNSSTDKSNLNSKDDTYSILDDTNRKYIQIGITNISNEDPVSNYIFESISDELSSKSYTVINNSILDNAIELTNCSIPVTQRCLSEELGKYPGIRYIINISKSKIPDQFPGTLSVEYQVIDTALIYAYPKTSFSSPIRSLQHLNREKKRINTNIANSITSYSSATPSLYRAFNNIENNKKNFYISIGTESGFTENMKFKIVRESETVFSPQNLPAGLIIKSTVGELEIIKVLSNNLSLCKLVSGEPPGISDLVIMTK